MESGGYSIDRGKPPNCGSSPELPLWTRSGYLLCMESSGRGEILRGRCRRRTWRSCARSTRPGSAATTARPSGRTPRSSSCRRRPSSGSWTGVAAMAEAWREALSAWEEFRAEADEYRCARRRARARAQALQRARQDERTGGRGHTDEGANLFHIRDGKVTRLVLYWDRESALADAGCGSRRCPRRTLSSLALPLPH